MTTLKNNERYSFKLSQDGSLNIQANNSSAIILQTQNKNKDCIAYLSKSQSITTVDNFTISDITIDYVLLSQPSLARFTATVSLDKTLARLTDLYVWSTDFNDVELYNFWDYNLRDMIDAVNNKDYARVYNRASFLINYTDDFNRTDVRHIFNHDLKANIVLLELFGYNN